MATVANAFDLLRSGEQPSASKNKKKKNKTKQKTTADEGAPAVTAETTVAETTSGNEVVELADAVPILEKSARTQGPNRIKLWKDWQRQVGDAELFSTQCSVTNPHAAALHKPTSLAVGPVHTHTHRQLTAAPRHSSTGHQMAASSSSRR